MLQIRIGSLEGIMINNLVVVAEKARDPGFTYVYINQYSNTD